MEHPTTPTREALALRSFQPGDYAAYVALLNAARPDDPTTEDDVRLMDAQRDPGPAGRVLLAELEPQRGERLLGAYSYAPPRNPRPGKVAVRLAVHPDAPRDAAGELFAHLLRDLQSYELDGLLTNAREDAWDYRFYVNHGFRETDRMFTSTLDVTTFDATPFEHFETRSRAAGVRVATLSDLPSDEAFQRRLYDLIVELLGDVPAAATFEPWSFETWQERVWNSPKRRPQGHFVALRNDELIGVSELYASSRPGTLQTGLTGVKREYRRLGVAQTLKVAAARHARDSGFRYVRTSNHTVNRPMLGINEAMGFEKEPAWVTLEFDLSGQRG